MLSLVHYDAAATVMRQCDDQRGDRTVLNMISHSAMLPRHFQFNSADRFTQSIRMTCEQVCYAKTQLPVTDAVNLGVGSVTLWRREHSSKVYFPIHPLSFQMHH